MTIQKKVVLLACLIILIECIFARPQLVYAESKQAEIITTTVRGDLTVAFDFDRSVVDIIFISPSGERKTAQDADVDYAFGDLWSTYCIHDAAPGTWRVEYELGNNSEIRYSIIDNNLGIWLQFFEPETISGNHVSFRFEADCESGTVEYNYEIFALSTTGAESNIQISAGSAKSNQIVQTEADLSAISSGEYVFIIDVYCLDGTAELYDSMKTESFIYNNPNEPASISDYKIVIETDTLTCSVDWTNYANRGCEAYRVQAEADGEQFYFGEFGNDETALFFSYPQNAKELQIAVCYKYNGVWSTPKVKSIDLANETLSNASGEITGALQMTLRYNTIKERILTVRINGEEGTYRINGEGSLAFDLSAGSNSIYARFDSENMVSFVVDTQIYYDSIPPKIDLYEDLDGKTIYADSVNITGKMIGGATFRINGVSVELDESGIFSYEVSLSEAENVVEMEAEDTNGNVTRRILTIYKGTSDATARWMQFFPLFASAIASVLIAVLSFAYLKKEEAHVKRQRNLVGILVALDIILLAVVGVCTWQFVERYIFCNSIKYLEMAEKSAYQAAKYLRMERFYGLASMSGAVLLIICIAATVLVSKRRRKQ